jgi:hypothetical protein
VLLAHPPAGQCGSRARQPADSNSATAKSYLPAPKLPTTTAVTPDMPQMFSAPFAQSSA